MPPALGIDLCPPEIFIPPGQGPNAIWPSMYVTPLDQIVSDPTLVDADGLSWSALEPGTYVYHLTLIWSPERSRTGIKVAMDFSGAFVLTRYYVRDAAKAATTNAEPFTTRGKAGAVHWLTIDGVLVSEAVGDLRSQIASEHAHPVTLQRGSFGTLQRLGT